MKSKKDAIRPLFDALQQDAEPVDPERQARTLNRFLRARLFTHVEGEKRAVFRVADPDADSRLNPRPDEPKQHSKPRTPRS
jgi:hypothetical protein